jgi:Uma2 family endonuclease
MTTLPFSRPLTRDDLDVLPDDGHRYEVVDGSLIVTPMPSWLHQRAVVNLLLGLYRVCPLDLEVLPGPFEVTIAMDTVLLPDVVVARRSDYSERGLQSAPVLAIEVSSEHTRWIDLALKRSTYEAAGCASYWVVDPDDPSLVAWDLRDGKYVEVGKVSGDEEFRAVLPFGVGVVPDTLVR